MDAVKIGNFLCALRKGHGWTQQEAATRLGITDKSISKWENARGMPDIVILPALAELYGVSVDELLAGERAATRQTTESPAAASPASNQQKTGWIFPLFFLICFAEGALVVLSGLLSALLQSYAQIAPYLDVMSIGNMDRTALTAHCELWYPVCIDWQMFFQSLSMWLLPVAAAFVLIHCLRHRIAFSAALLSVLLPAAISFSLSFALLIPIWKTPHLFMGWANLYLYWFTALRSTLILFCIYSVLFLFIYYKNKKGKKD